jgi:hypothetical protein
MAEYTAYVAVQTTGEIVGDIPLEGAEFQKRLQGGSFRASVPLDDLSEPIRRDIVEMTTPGKYSVVLDRDGYAFGEWLIWTRTRNVSDQLMQISGNEVLSHLDHRLLGELHYLQVEQLQIASDIASSGFGTFGAAGSVNVEMAAFTPSNRVRDRNYDIAEASNGQRLKELSEVIDGFDYDIATSWKTVSGRRYVRRVFNLYYPRKGSATPFVFDMGNYGGNASALSVTEDARNYSSQAWALGGNTESGKAIAASGLGESWLGRGFPFRQTTKTWFSVNQQPTIQAHADALQALGQVVELPADLSVYADGHPSVRDYDTGDLVLCTVDPCDQFPDGWGGEMRIQGITLRPNDPNGEDIAELELTPASSLPGTNEDN